MKTTTKLIWFLLGFFIFHLVCGHIVTSAQNIHLVIQETNLRGYDFKPALPNVNKFDRLVSVNFENVKLELALREIAETIGISLSYSPDMVSADKLVTLQKENFSVRDVIHELVSEDNVGLLVHGTSNAVLTKIEYVAQETATIEGTVVNAETNEPLPGANVLIQGTYLGAATDREGRYRISIPAEQITDEEASIIARYVGFRAETRIIRLTAGVHEVNFTLKPDVFGLEEIVVTGVPVATFKERLPFSVDVVTRAELEIVPYSSAESALRGKVSGLRMVRPSGIPGTTPEIILRGPTGWWLSNEPLYVVDGVVLESAGTIDIDGLDIETIEVVKGAAAASLYGSRAAQGVIHIRTRTGGDLADGQTRITMRNEYGFNQLANYKEIHRRHHPYLVDENNQYIRPDGSPIVERGERHLDHSYVPGVAFAVNPYPQWFDHARNIFQTGPFYLNSLNVSHRTESTNIYASLSNTRETGILKYQDGFSRQNLRLNLDHRILPNLNISIRSSYARGERDRLPLDPFQRMVNMPPDADLHEPNPIDGTPYNPDAAPHGVDNTNPLYHLKYSDRGIKRERVLGGITLSYYPLRWLNIDGMFSYDLSRRHTWSHWPKGFLEPVVSVYNLGRIYKEDVRSEGMNANIDLTLTRSFGKLDSRAQVRYQAEIHSYEAFEVSSDDLVVKDVPSLTAAQHLLYHNSAIRERRSEIYYFIGVLDYDGRYISDFLIRRDGSSLFGIDERWQTYYRISGAWRIAQERWWGINSINELKLRYSIGTAGGRPGWSHQYETYNIVDGRLTKDQLGNRMLRPQFSTEQEVGLELGIFDRIFFEVNYARTTTEGVVRPAPLPYLFGYTTQIDHIGDSKSRSWEASIRTILISRRDIRWSSRLSLDTYSTRITRMDVPEYRAGAGGNLLYREGERIGTFYGHLWMTRHSQLTPALQPFSDYFQVNDDGYLVPVGSGTSWRDGISKQLWGTTVEITDEDGNIHRFAWGLPMRYIDEEGNDWHRLGLVEPDFMLYFSNNFTYKNLNIYLLVDARVGGQIYNRTKLFGKQNEVHRDYDQTGKPQERWKPVSYINTLYNGAIVNSHYVEDGSWLKIRELAVRYTFRQPQLRRFFGGWINNISVGVIGRNLLTFSAFDGFDPEVGGIIGAEDSYAYPNYRTFTGFFEITF